MLDGIGAYTDRDKYLARSLTVLGQMEGLVQEPPPSAGWSRPPSPMTPVDLAACIQGCIQEYAGLFEQRKLLLRVHLTPGLWILGNPALLGKAIRNVLSNGALYPSGSNPEHFRLQRRSYGHGHRGKRRRPPGSRGPAPSVRSLLPG